MSTYWNSFLTAKDRRERKKMQCPSLRSLRSFAVTILLFWCAHAQAAEWVEAYRGGDYSNAFQALEETASTFPDIGNYNRGNILYRQKDFQGSEKAFAKAAALTEDNELKHKALYNRGTALLAGCTGDLQVAPEKQLDAKIDAATQAAGLFEQALALKPDDLDSKQNLERALKLKEQLEQQKQEQEQEEEQQEQNQQQQPSDESDPSDKSDQQQSRQDRQKQQEPQDRQQQNQDQQKQNQQDQQSQDQQDQDQQQQQPARPKQAGEMSEEEAQQLLDAMKQDEQDQRANLRPYLGQPVRVNKDW